MSQRSGRQYREATRLEIASQNSTPSGSYPSSARASPIPSTSKSGSLLPNHYSYPPSQQAYGAARTAEDLEGQNEDHLSILSGKVKMLKEITSNIGKEVVDSTKLLAGMNDSFSETSGILSGTFSRMNKMAKRQGGLWCYWMAFLAIVLTVFFWVWVFRR